MPPKLGLELDSLPGGAYRRTRLRGGPSEIYPRIGTTFEQMSADIGSVDGERPWLEHYRAHNEVDLLVPVSG